MSNEIQTVITILIVFTMVLLGIRTIKKYGIKSKNSFSKTACSICKLSFLLLQLLDPEISESLQ